MSTDTALERTGPQSTGIGLYEQAPNQSTAIATVVPLDRENLTFFANMIKAAGLVPKVPGVTPEIQFNRVMAKIVAGVSYGFDPILSQTCFHAMFDGLSKSAECYEILFRRSGEYDTRIEYLNDTGCKVKVLKRDDEGKWRAIGEVEFTREMAEKAELTKNSMYKKFGPDMFYARVMTRVVKRYNPSCLQPTVLLGNHFARESQPNFGAPPAPPAQLQNAIPETPAAETEPSGVPISEHADPEYIEGEVIQSYDDGDGAVTEYTEPQPIEEQPPASEPSAPVDPEESKYQDLLTTAKELYTELSGPEKKKADAFIGSGNLLKNLDAERLAEFLDTFTS